MIEGVTKEAFHAIRGVSYSKLSKLADGPQAYKASLEKDQTGSGLDFGSVVDVKLTSPETFDKEFYVMTADKPESDMMLRFAEVYAITGDPERAWSASGFKINIARVMDKFNVEGKDYYDALIIGKDRKIIDASMVMKANQAVAMLKANPYSKYYFTPEHDQIEIKFQVHLVWDIETDDLMESGEREFERKNTTTKGIIDIIRIDHLKKEIDIVDQKTGAEGFWKAFWKWRYYLQGSLYYFGVIKLFAEQYPDYTINPTKFLYMDSNLINPPVIYKMNVSDVIHGRDGYYTTKLKYKGYAQLASELYWHNIMDKWDYPYELYMNNGEIEIDAFNVKL